MLNIKIEGLKKTLKGLDNIARKQLPFATALALTNTAKDVQKELKKEMRKVFDKPTPWILNSMLITNANKRDINMFSEVFFKDKAVKYIEPHIYGGGRKQKRSEIHFERAGLGKYYVPGQSMGLDRYGNVKGGHITRILSAVKAHPDVYSRTTKSSRKRNKKVGKYFAITNTGGKLKPAVYKRTGPRTIKPVLVFTRGVPKYRKRFKFVKITGDVVVKKINKNFRSAFNFAMRTAKR